ncbi:EAL domain-containing protein, partial [Immundisolibacter sp.]|uniref:EAL domain-containing protein n=1 Tax=Immundisolibacter sp. TaxID=1934948 RepID=UPI0035632C09
RITGVPGINFGYPVVDTDGRVQAVVFAAVSTDWLAGLVDPGVLPAGASVTVLDRRLQLMAHLPSSVGDDDVLSTASAALPGRLAERREGGGIRVTAADGSAWHFTYVPLGGMSLATAPYLLLGLPLDALHAQLAPFVRMQPLMVMVAQAVLALLVWFGVRGLVVQPVRGLVEAASSLAEGVRGVRLPERHRVAELSLMGTAFNHMANQVDGAVRAYRVLSAGNRTLLREHEEQRLLDAMCRVVVEHGSYRYAGVAYVTEAGIQQMAGAGEDEGFTAYLQAHWQTALAHQTPTVRALSSGEPVVQQFMDREAGHGLFQLAASRGLHSGVILPLKVDGRIIGALTVYSSAPDAFAAREMRLLAELADDLSFGIVTARLRERESRADAHLRRVAYFDDATGLPNRVRFLDQLATSVTARRDVAVLVVELFNYWEIATALGHATGHEFLQVVAERLRSRGAEHLARVAQSELAVRVDVSDETAACHFADDLLAALATPALLSSISVDIDATVGVAVGRGDDGERLLQAARLAAREAKKSHARVLLAHPRLDNDWRDRLRLAADLREAIDERHLSIHLQPQVDLRTGEVCGVEALARWRHPEHGVISPAQFIGLAERTGLIRNLTQAILEAVSAQAARHAAAGLHLPIAMNVSARNLHDPAFFRCLKDALETWPQAR